MYVEGIKGLGKKMEIQCPVLISMDDVRFMVRALDSRVNDRAKRRINVVTDAMFIRRHPERLDKKSMKVIPLPLMKSANSEEQMLILEWLHIRNCLVMPAHRAWLKFLKK